MEIWVSIHLMLLLNKLRKKALSAQVCFNTSYVVIKLLLTNLIIIGICRFNTSYVVIKQTKVFQMPQDDEGFNTSYVVIKRVWVLCQQCKGDVSIHLMLLLNPNK